MHLSLVERLAAVTAAATLTTLQLEAVVALAGSPQIQAAAALAHGDPRCALARPG
jgi:hypothetical protein